MAKYSYEIRKLSKQILANEPENLMRASIHCAFSNLMFVYFILLILMTVIVSFVFDISLWGSLIAVSLFLLIGTSFAEKKVRNAEKRNQKFYSLKEHCQNLTDLKISIVPNYKNWKKIIPNLDLSACKKMQNQILLEPIENGTLLSGTIPLYFPQDNKNKKAPVQILESNRLIPHEKRLPMMFQFPQKGGKKNINYEMMFIADGERIYFGSEELYNLRQNTDMYNKEDQAEYEKHIKNNLYVAVNIWFEELQNQLLCRWIETVKNTEDKYFETKDPWAKKYLFKSAEYRNRAKEIYFQKRRNLLYHPTVSKTIKYGPLNADFIVNPWTDAADVKYSHDYTHDIKYLKYGAFISGAIHTYETEFFIIKISHGKGI